MRVGNIRKLDDFGRIVIPSDIRNRLGISSGDSLEITSNNECVFMTKYEGTCNWETEASKIAEAISSVLHLGVIICNETCAIAAAGLDPQTIVGRPIYKENVCRNNVYDSINSDGDLYVVNSSICARYIQPIRKFGRTVGAIAVIQPKNFIPEAEEFSDETAKTLLRSYATYIENLAGGTN